jgi:hypothetical protein
MKKMKPYLIALAIVASVSTLLSFVDSERKSATSAKLDQTIADWERAKAYTKAYLDASSEDVINFKPTPEMRSFAEQLLHLAEGNYGMTSAASGKASPITRGALEKSDQYKTKETLTKAVMDSYDFAIAAAKELNEQKLGEKIKMFDRFEMTREVGMTKGSNIKHITADKLPCT